MKINGLARKVLFCAYNITTKCLLLVKPRILAPNTNGGKGDTGESQGMPTAPKITVNELSAESIKRGFKLIFIFFIR